MPDFIYLHKDKLVLDANRIVKISSHADKDLGAWITYQDGVGIETFAVYTSLLQLRKIMSKGRNDAI